jgi:hypothetical protein
MKILRWTVPVVLSGVLGVVAYQAGLSLRAFLAILGLAVLIGSAQYKTYIDALRRAPQHPWRARLIGLSWVGVVPVGLDPLR